jgi:peroxiredoxin/competence transcription factor ComK
MKKLLLGLTVLLAVACNENQKNEFSLRGTTNGFENGTVLYLAHKNEIIDSTTIENNLFVFNTKLPSSPVQVWLHNKDFSNYRAFWVENSEMTFDAGKTEFRDAVITGCKTQTENNVLSEQLKPVRDEIIALEDSYSETMTREQMDFLRAQYMLLEKREVEIYQNFIKENPNSLVSVYLLSVYTTTWGKEKTEELYEKFSQDNKDTEYGKQILRYIELNKEPKIGDKFVDFQMEDSKGDIQKLSDIKGKAVLLEFWASWCGPCRHENPALVKTYTQFNSKGFEIFAVSLDEDKENWLKAIEKDGLSWIHVSDLKGQGNEASLIYGINGIPDNFLIDENGIIIGRGLDGEELYKKLEEILK